MCFPHLEHSPLGVGVGSLGGCSCSIRCACSVAALATEICRRLIGFLRHLVPACSEANAIMLYYNIFLIWLKAIHRLNCAGKLVMMCSNSGTWIGARLSALPPKADLFQHWHLCLLLTLSGHYLKYAFTFL